MWGPILSGVAVGAVVSAAARILGTAVCGPAEPRAQVSLGGDCSSLVASMAIRVGVAVGMATVVLALIATGLMRTAARLEEDRRLRALEGAPAAADE